MEHAPPRHACLSCGGSCQGVRVSVLAEEQAAVVGYAAALEVDQPIVGGRLRMNWGRCVFLDEEARCRIHARFGPEAKPRVCQQYPLVVVETETGERRVGVDPGCYTAVRTYQDGPVVSPGAVVTQVPLDEAGVAAEAEALQRLDEAQTVADVIGEEQDAAVALLEALAAIDFVSLILRQDTGETMRLSLAPLAVLVRRGTFEPPVLTPEDHAWALRGARAMVWLRLLRGRAPERTSHLVLAGAVALATHPPTARAGLAGWCRALRAPALQALP